ncbi:MAG TPA: NAD(P)-dependent oxidoreductase [Terriglobales bacterium]|jgi:3-hydroxyisobutyrate dehydrogenase-like beta-hydroxyacid dehydrogenase
MKIGFIGLGNMGGPMAANLLKSGHEITVYNRTTEKAQNLVNRGARLAKTPAEASKGDVVFTMLADDGALESVVFGDAGVLDGLTNNAIHISSSTISVALSQRLTAEHANRGQRFVSAPVFGRPEAATAAKLFVVAAGPADAVQNCMPLFHAIGQRTFLFGVTPANANLVKLSGNFLIASTIEALSEAMALVCKGGIDQHEYLDFLTSTLFAAPVYKTYGGLIADKKFSPPGFVAPLGLKDVRLALAAGEGLQVPLPLASLIRDRFLRLLANGGEALDWSAVSQLAAEDAGLKK